MSNLTLKKISTKPYLFGIEKHHISEEDFYFDNDHFYAINKELQKAIFNLCDISEIKKTSITINNRRIWQITIKPTSDKEVVFKFAHNFSLWNRNFPLFYNKVKKKNPKVLQSKWSIWTR